MRLCLNTHTYLRRSCCGEIYRAHVARCLNDRVVVHGDKPSARSDGSARGISECKGFSRRSENPKKIVSGFSLPGITSMVPSHLGRRAGHGTPQSRCAHNPPTRTAVRLPRLTRRGPRGDPQRCAVVRPVPRQKQTGGVSDGRVASRRDPRVAHHPVPRHVHGEVFLRHPGFVARV